MLVLGEMEVAQVNPHRSGQGTPSAPGQVRIPRASGGHPMQVGDTGSTTGPDG